MLGKDVLFELFLARFNVGCVCVFSLQLFYSSVANLAWAELLCSCLFLCFEIFSPLPLVILYLFLIHLTCFLRVYGTLALILSAHKQQKKKTKWKKFPLQGLSHISKGSVSLALGTLSALHNQTQAQTRTKAMVWAYRRQEVYLLWVVINNVTPIATVERIGWRTYGMCVINFASPCVQQCP